MVRLGLTPYEAGCLTLSEYQTLMEVYTEEEKNKNELFSICVFNAIANSFRKKGAPYRNLFEDEKEKDKLADYREQKEELLQFIEQRR